MTNSQLFKAAHELTRKTIKQGDNYQVTFGACLKALKVQSAKPVEPTIKQRLKMVRRAYKLAKSMKNDTINGTWSVTPFHNLFKQAFKVEYGDCVDRCPKLGVTY